MASLGTEKTTGGARAKRRLSPDLALKAEQFLAKARYLLLWSPGCLNVRRERAAVVAAEGSSAPAAPADAPSSSSSPSAAAPLISPGQKLEGVVEIDISDWCDIIDESFLRETTQYCRQVCLTITRVDDVSFHDNLLTWVCKYVSPKLVELTVCDCSALGWTSHVKRILEAAGAVEVINFQKNQWVDDFVVDQITTKFAKSLRSLDLENTKITDNGLYHVGRRCANMRTLTLNCCPKITDTGLHQLAKKIHLSNINLCHNVQITDGGLERLIASSNQLYSVRLTNCPKLTDNAMEAMYEAIAAWGKRRNTKSLTLRALELRDNPLMTFQALVFLSTAVPNLVTLDLRDCVNIDLTKGMHEMERMRYLEEIYLGPSNHQLKAEDFLQSMLFHAANLKVLHLTQVGNMDDDDLAELISATLLLNDFCVDGMDVGVHTIEAICSHVPNLTKFKVTGSKCLTDPDVRCLASICLFLRELTLRHCPLLSDGAFSRCVGLKRLKTLEISYCSPSLSGAFLGFFTTCPLEILVLEGIAFKPSVHFKQMTIKTIGSLRELELKNARIMNTDDVLFLLATFVNCGSLDLTGSAMPETLLRALPTLRHSHPFMSYTGSAGADFLGFSESVEARTKHKRFFNIQILTRKFYAARKIQRVRRGFVKWRNDILEKQRLERIAHRLKCITKIQSVFRMCLTKKRVLVKLSAGRMIVKVARKFLDARFMKKYILARKFYTGQLKIKLMRLLKAYTSWSKASMVKIVARVLPRLAFRSRTRTYRYFRDQEDNMREDRLYHHSLVVWEGHLLSLMIKKWKLLRGETKLNRAKIAKMMIVVADLGRQNSYRQLLNLALAQGFYATKLKVLVWICFADDFIRSRKADLLVPRAQSHFARKFFDRVVRFCFKGIIYYVETKRIKHISKLKAEEGRLCWLRFNGFRHTFEEAIRVKRIKKNQVTAYAGYFNYYAKMTLQNRFPVNVMYERHIREVRSKVVYQWANYKVDYYFHNMMYNCLRFKHWREMEYLAEQMFVKTYSKNYFAQWVHFQKTNAGMGDFLYRKYCLKWATVCIASLRTNVQEGREYREKITLQMAEAAARQAKEGEDAAAAAARVMATLTRGVIKLQAVVRGIVARKQFSAIKVKLFYATQVLQNFGRRGLAVLKFKEKRRTRLLFLHKLEDGERIEMRKAEIESGYMELVWKNAIVIQGCYRGYRGRLAFAEIAWATIRVRGKELYLKSATLKRNLEQAREAMAMRERFRGKSATLIQKRVRGMLARFRFVRVKLQAKKVKCTINVQKAYRKRLAMLKLNAMRRDKWRELRYIAARNQRGILLRLIGLPKRKQQRQFASTLTALGLDPISFNYRFRELVEETVNDCKEMVHVMLREIALLRKHGFNKKDRDMDKRTLLGDHGVGLDIMDACKIIREDHPFVGATGIVARIDTSIPGVPLYEIALDSVKRQTFVHMTTDPLMTYLYPQPLDEIATKPKLEGFVQRFVLYGVNEGDPIFTRRNISAAWRIQRAFRCYRSRRIVARRRFELWLQSCDRQWSFFNQLADNNSLTMQSNYFLNYLGVRPVKPVHYDEVRHPFYSGRYDSAMKKKNEKKAILLEWENKYRERLLYLQKQSLFRGKEYWGVGFDRLTLQRKLAMFFQRSCGFSSKGKTSIKDLAGSSGAKFVAKSQAMVTGMSMYDFKQFKDSPHVRYYKTYMYQGNWSGIPLFTPLRPHGEGLLVFFDGWGFAREDKVLYLEICCARYLNAADLDTSDPYCDINCNSTNLQTTVKWMNLNPMWHEKFEIDVTNPDAKVSIVVYDKDYIGDDDFLGQITIPLSKYIDGKEHKETFLLKGEDEGEDEDFDRGEIDVKIRWTNRKFEDDLARDVIQKAKAIRIQAWARRIASIAYRSKILKDRQVLLDLVRRRSIQITNTCRIRIARKKLMKRRRRLKACVMIQCRARIRQARLIYWYRRKRHRAAIKIQTLMRKCLAKAIVRRMKKDSKDALSGKAAIIQKFARRKIAYLTVRRMKDELKLLSGADAEDDGDVERAVVEKPPVSSWIHVYGVDPDYGLRRNRRMTKCYFDRMLKMQFVRLVTTRLGIVYVDQHPAEKSKEDAAYERSGEKALTNRDDFVGVFFPPFNPKVTHRNEAVELCEKFGHMAFVHIPSTVDFRKTVAFNVTTIQCAARQRIARKKSAFMMKLHKAFTKLQRAFRKRSQRLQIAALRIQALFHLIHAKVVSSLVRREKRGASCIQSAYRCFKARCAMFDLRCVSDMSVLKFSSAVPFHGPQKTLDFKSRSFWMAESTDKAELRFEMKKKECIDQIWIMTSTHSSQPKYVEISTVVDKASKKFKILVEKAGLKFLKGSLWHKFAIEETTAKYFKFEFFDNYGDDSHIAVRQVRFVRLKEKSATIVKQPPNVITDEGPTVGRRKRLTLRCEAEGWPRPTFQWFRNGQQIPNATSDSLQLSLKCKLSKKKRIFRCLKCKMYSKNVPLNAYHVVCGNCSAPFSFKDIQEYDEAIKALIKASEAEVKEYDSLIESRDTMASQSGERAKYLLGVIVKQLAEVDAKLQNNREARYSAKSDLACTNRFSDEGVYQCVVSNIRGGSVPIVRRSIRAVVVIQHSVPYRIAVKPNYVPRLPSIRKKWTVYHSILGTFKKGVLEGLVRIRYSDGAFYEGPYISEEWLNDEGHLNPIGKAKDHYGIYRCPDGRTFEGFNVDNHFDPFNLQTFFRLTLPNAEVYEGMFCDEMFHGAGLYKFKDGSVYEGQWFKGSQFGHGHLRSTEGWAYEGYFDTNRRHGEGVITYSDGSIWMGRWYYGKRQGAGVYISVLRDVFRGEVVDGLFHGNGEMLYSDGSRYTGEFKTGKRHGIGIFCDAEGTQSYGNFVEDLRHGEHIIKAVIPIEEEGQANLEIRVGVFDHGQFVKWKIKYSNPVATKRFIELFQADRSMFDSVYSMVLARNLPNIPDGVDGLNEDVQAILKRVRNEAGGLVGEEALLSAKRKLEELLKNLTNLKSQIKAMQKEIDEVSSMKIEYTQDALVLLRKCNALLVMAEKEEGRIEQFWMDEPGETRPKFEIACNKLQEVEGNDYFNFRNHRLPPPFSKRILDGVCLLLGESTEWKNEQLMLGDSVTLAREGDDLGLRFDFECKLSFMMAKPKEFKVVTYAKIEEGREELERVMADPRMRPESYYVESAGPAGPPIVTWIKATYNYVRKARTILPALAAVEDKRAQAFRFKAQSTKKTEDAAITERNIGVLKENLTKVEAEALDAEEALARATDMFQFLGKNALMGGDQETLDYYQTLERKIEERRDHFVVETALQFCVDGVENRLDFELKAKIRDALIQGEVYEEPPVEHPQIRDWLTDEVRTQQTRIIDSGRTLGYAIPGDPEPHAISWELTQDIIERIANVTMAKMNEKMNDLADATRWATSKGKIFDSRFFYVLTWKMWEADGEEAKELKACAAWEEIFVTPEECAKMALEAKVNERMAEKARGQGKIWAKRHRMEIEQAEAILAEQFAYEFPDETARQAMELMEDESPQIPPATKSACLCWARLNPRELNDARDERNQALGDQFGKQYGEAAGELAFRIFNGLATEEELVWYDFAAHWRTYHEHDYHAAGEKVTTLMATAHADAFAISTADEAAHIIEGDAIGQMIRDEEVKATNVFDHIVYFNARCWGMRNQGLLRGATKKLRAKHATIAHKLWGELETQTDSFRKGSYLLTPAEIRDDSNKDRFFGFRARLENKFAWLFGYLTKMHFEYYNEMENLDIKDPYGKVIHNIRPTKLEKHLKAEDQAFLRHKREVENGLSGVLSKLSTWNSYFGKRENEKIDKELTEEMIQPPA